MWKCRVLRGGLPRLRSTNSVGARIPEREVLAPFVLLPCSLLCSLPPSPHARQLEKGDLWIKGTVNRAQVAKKSQTLAHVDRAAVWGGKFRDTRVNHENNKN